MADLSDVNTVLATLVAGVVYPLGIGQPSVLGAGSGVKIYAGWPNAAQLDTDLRAATPVCHVSIYPRPDERNTTRYSDDLQQVSVNTATLTLVLGDQTLTVGGTIPGAGNPHNVVVQVGGKPYVYTVLVSDTLTSIAAALAALVVVDVPGTVAAGPVITFPRSARVGWARVGVTGVSASVLRNQERLFQIGVWANTPANRDALAKAIDQALAALTFLTMPDGLAARIRYKSSAMSDALQKDCLFRRDLFYTVDYATTALETDTQITEVQINTAVAPSGITPYATPLTTYF